jgi:hypothetical protein
MRPWNQPTTLPAAICGGGLIHQFRFAQAAVGTPAVSSSANGFRGRYIRAIVSVLHHESAGLMQALVPDRQGRADGSARVAGGRLNIDIAEGRLFEDLAVGRAVERDAARQA